MSNFCLCQVFISKKIIFYRYTHEFKMLAKKNRVFFLSTFHKQYSVRSKKCSFSIRIVAFQMRLSNICCQPMFIFSYEIMSPTIIPCEKHCTYNWIGKSLSFFCYCQIFIRNNGTKICSLFRKCFFELNTQHKNEFYTYNPIHLITSQFN